MPYTIQAKTPEEARRIARRLGTPMTDGKGTVIKPGDPCIQTRVDLTDPAALAIGNS